MAAVRGGWQGAEPRAIRRAVSLLERLEGQCQDPRLAFGHPSLSDLLPRIAHLLREVASARSAAGDAPEGPGGAWDFLVTYLANLEAKGRQVEALLPRRGRKDANQELFPEGYRLRRQLAKLALIFSHMHAELAALFPGGHYCGHLYQLTKAPAHTFWRQYCGVRCVLPWAEFESLLCTCHPVEPGPTAQALRSTMDLTCSGHVSVFEFDIFTRLFQPWPTLLRNWQLLAVNHPGYMAFLTYDEVQTRLQACRDKPGSYLYPDGKNHSPDLSELFQAEPHQRIHVSEQSDNQTCPFCRCEIKGREAVSISRRQGGAEEDRSVVPSAPPLPPRLDLSPRSPKSERLPKVKPLALPRLRAPLPLPKMRTVALFPWDVPSSPQSRDGATGGS
uniref:E3 ubiquitin-protein ligase CBL n=1 Tax=Jaculus jaculus TaxID=51337 RepID=A0A8C5KTF2_JACJA